MHDIGSRVGLASFGNYSPRPGGRSRPGGHRCEAPLTIWFGGRPRHRQQVGLSLIAITQTAGATMLTEVAPVTTERMRCIALLHPVSPK